MASILKLTNNNFRCISKIFANSQETFVMSYLQGYMGQGWTDNIQNPSCAKILVGAFCMLAGDFNSPSAIELVKNIQTDFQEPCMLIIPQNQNWGNLIENIYKNKFKKVKRYAIKKEQDCFNKDKLQGFVDSLPPDFQITKIDKNLYHKTQEINCFKNLCWQFLSAEDYISRGLGFCILHEDEVVCGASSCYIYDGGIEIEIDTKKKYRRLGLATACAAKLIIECLDNNLYPSWDAENKESVLLAEKLGYHFDKEYDGYKISINR